MKKNVFEKIKNEKFNALDIKKMSRIQGGYTANTMSFWSKDGHVYSHADDGGDGYTTD